MRRIPPHAVDRPALRAQLDAGATAPLSLIVAPAGAGKTVLLAQWALHLPDRSVAWVDLEPAEAGATVFSRRLVAAIQAVAPQFRAPISPVASAEARFGDRYVEELAMALGDAGRLVVIFDDLDRLSGTAVLTDLWQLVDMLPPTVHFVFSSRTDLRLGWSRQRLQYGLVEIRQRELAFDVTTTAQVLERISGRPISEATATAVTVRTDGWAVGVQLTALTMRTAADPEQIVQTMSGTDRLVMDYLSEEVLDALEPARRTALIRMAVLDESCAPLAEAVTGVDGVHLLSGLERDSMFISPVDGRPGWYRLHRLFRDLLLLRLRAHDRSAEPDLLETAAQWHAVEGDDEAAVEYLIRAHRWEEAISRILRIGQTFYAQHRMATVAGWLSAVPESVRSERADAEIALALARGFSGEATRAVDALRMLLAGDRLTVGERQVVLSYLAACVQFDPHPEFFLDTAQQALAELDRHPDAELPDIMGLTSRALLRIVSEVSLGRALLFLGRIDDARISLRSALRAVGMAYVPYRVHTLGSLALAEALNGRLVAAAQNADEALALAEASELLTHPSPADAYLARAVVAVQRGEPEAGALALHEGALRAASNQRTQLMWLAWLISTIVEPETGHPDHAEPAGLRPQFVREGAIAVEMRKSRVRGTPLPPPGAAQTWSSVVFEEIAGCVALGLVDEARTRLSRWPEEPEPSGPLARTEFRILAGWICAAQGRRAASREHLEEALRVAEPEWLVHPFVRAGPAVADLIDGLPGIGGPFRRTVVRRARAAGVPRGEQPLEGLTPRERELLAYLPSRLTISDIARRCFVSANTVKTHLGHIYRKLDVPGRDGAVERAEELGLLDAEVTVRMP